MLEREIVQQVVDSGFLSGRSVFTEIPVGRPARSNKRIDIVALEENSNRQPIVIAIEAKIANWRKALQQAFLNLFVAEYSYVAVPEIRLRSIDRDCFGRAGIGLLAVNGSVDSVLEPSLSSHTLAEKKKYVLDWCRRVEGERSA
jgi:hypothetical protein